MPTKFPATLTPSVQVHEEALRACRTDSLPGGVACPLAFGRPCPTLFPAFGLRWRSLRADYRRLGKKRDWNQNQNQNRNRNQIISNQIELGKKIGALPILG